MPRVFHIRIDALVQGHSDLMRPTRSADMLIFGITVLLADRASLLTVEMAPANVTEPFLRVLCLPERPGFVVGTAFAVAFPSHCILPLVPLRAVPSSIRSASTTAKRWRT